MAFLVERALAMQLDLVAQVELPVGASQDALQVEGGKRLPLAFEQGKHLPERVAKRLVRSHQWFLNCKPAAIIASAIFVGTTG